METTSSSKTWQRYVRTRLISGFLVLVPLWVTYFVAKTLFGVMGSVLQPLFRLLPWELSPAVTWCLSVAAFLLVVFLVGVVTSRMIGKRMVGWGEALILRVPVIKNIYGAAKQVIDAISLPGKNSFQSVALVEFPRPGMCALGFVTGEMRDEEGNVWARVFVPTAPNPTSGFLQLVRREDVRTVDMSVESAIKVIVSGGFIAPDILKCLPKSGKA